MTDRSLILISLLAVLVAIGVGFFAAVLVARPGGERMMGRESLSADLDAAITALRMIQGNDVGEGWSAGVAMSALASIEERHSQACCGFTSAAGVRCTKGSWARWRPPPLPAGVGSR